MNNQDYAQLLEEKRRTIRAIDRHILTLLKDRMSCAHDIASIKKILNLPIKNQGVEQELLKENCQAAEKLGLDPRIAEDLTGLLVHYAVDAQMKKLTNN